MEGVLVTNRCTCDPTRVSAAHDEGCPQASLTWPRDGQGFYSAVPGPPTLRISGGVTYVDLPVPPGGTYVDPQMTLAALVAEQQKQIAALTARVAALEARE